VSLKKTTGYSGTPLAKKLGIAEGETVCTFSAPSHYKALLAPLPPKVRFVTHAPSDVNMVHVFSTSRGELAKKLAELYPRIKPDAAVWVSWPKKAAKLATDITEDVVRELALPLGFVDVKVCAIDDVWSGLKLVIRKVNRVGRI